MALNNLSVGFSHVWRSVTMRQRFDGIDELTAMFRRGELSRREFIRLGLAAGGALALPAILAACAPASSPATAPAAPAKSDAPAPAAPAVQKPAAPAAPKKTDVTIVLEERIENIDPHDHNGLSAYLLFNNIYDSLLARDPSGKLVPALATEWKAIDANTWEFKLRQNVKFSNGEAWNAKAAKASIDRLVATGDWGTKRQFGLWRSMDRGEVVDDNTLRIITKTPMGAILSNLTLGAMLPETIAKKRAKEPITDQAEIVGTGPFRMTGWSPGQSVVLEPNPSYWGEVKPKMQKVTINTIIEAATRIAGLQAGNADVSWALQPLPAVNQLKTDANLQVVSMDSLRINWMAFSHKRKPFTDPKLREAAVRAVDFETIAKTILVGEGKNCRCLIAPGAFGAINDLDPKVNSYDPERSKTLLKEAGFAAGDGPAVRFIAPVGSPQQVLEALVDQLNKVGFKAKLELMEVGDYIKVRNDGEFDIFANGFTAVTGDAEFILPTMFYCKTSRSGYCNAEVDKLLDEAAAVTDQNKRLELYRKASELIWNDRADFWHYQVTLHIGANKKLKGLVIRPDNLLPLQNLEWE